MASNREDHRSADNDRRSEALVLIGHGSHRSSLAAQPIYRHADRIRERGVFDEVIPAFWKGEPAPREVLETVQSHIAYVVPVMMSDGYFTRHVIPRELDHKPPRKAATPALVYTDPVGTHPSLTDVIVQRASAITAPRAIRDGFGLIVVGHGTERHDQSAASTVQHARHLRETGMFEEVTALFLDEPPFLHDLTEHVDASDLIVVPLFVSLGPHTAEDIPAALGLQPGTDASPPVAVGTRRIWYTPPVGTHASIVDIILDRARDAGATLSAPQPTPVGPDSIESILDVFVSATHDSVDFDGVHAHHTPHGYTVKTPTDTSVGLTEDQLRTIATDHASLITNWYHWQYRTRSLGTDHRRFLRWLEHAETWPVQTRLSALTTGIHRTWGELTITTRATTTGTRRYTLHHRTDSESDGLEQLPGPRAVRDHVRFDDAGRFRPLSGANTLPTGWICTGLDSAAIIHAITGVYPVSITNWARETTGHLDVTHFRDTADRQTGRYADVGDVSSTTLAAAVRSICGTCTRRRQWDATTETPIDAPRGDSPIPCREPCHFFIAGLHELRQPPDPDTPRQSSNDAMVAAFEHPENPYRARFRQAESPAPTSPPEGS